jgi:hypothetical protein
VIAGKMKKIYEGLTARELALLALRALIVGDELELQRIRASARRFPAEFDHWLDRFRDALNCWGKEIWKSWAHTWLVEHVTDLAIVWHKREAMPDVFRHGVRHKSRTKALYKVLYVICAELRLPPELVLAHDDLDRFEEPEDSEVDGQEVDRNKADYLAIFGEMLGIEFPRPLRIRIRPPRPKTISLTSR